MIGTIQKDRYKVISKIGSGGNGIVYEVLDLQKNEKLALKTIKINPKELHKNKKEEIRLRRFIKEIIAVMEEQDKVSGVLPIFDYFLPPSVEDLKEGDKPFYVMPIAVPLEKKISNLEIYEKLNCIKDISNTLHYLHQKEIAHRDIKPENIYYFEGTWCLSDFGLVRYPDSEELTRTHEGVGPWKTIAPEMKRNAKYANPFSADIYSLAKTLWIILTGNYGCFDGQYNYKNILHSLEQYFSEGTHLTSLHELLTKSTSDDSTERPTAKEFADSVERWFQIEKSFEERSKAEWNFVMNEISPSNADSAVWRRIDRINNILESVSKLNFLNHVFLPDGGGLDLIDSKLSNEDGYIELNLNGEIRKIKPKQLSLQTFDDPQWNYLFLETETINKSGVYGNSTATKFVEHLLEIEPGKYIEPYHINYAKYEGNPLPEASRDIVLGLQGNYVIFPKNSFYNLKMDSYDAYQTQYNTPEVFLKFIEKTIEQLDWINNNPEEVEKLLKKRQEKEEENRQEWLEIHKNEENALNKYISDYDLPIDESYSKEVVGKVIYYISCNSTGSRNFYVSKDYKLVEANSQNDLMSLLKPNYENYLIIKSWEEAKYLSKKLISDFNMLTENFKTIISPSVSIILKRVKKPAILFDKSDLKKVIYNANDLVSNRIVIDEGGNIEVLELNPEMTYIDLKKYPVLGFDFDAKTNSVGKLVNYSEVEYDLMYLSLLDAWHRHLVDGGRKSLYDFTSYKEEELIKKIENEIKKY